MCKIRMPVVALLCASTALAGCASSSGAPKTVSDPVIIESPSGTTVKSATRIDAANEFNDKSYVVIEDGSKTMGKPVVRYKTGADEAYERALTQGHKLDKVRIGPGDLGDMGTTAYGLWSGVAEEANPILAPFGDAVPFVGIPVKYGAKKLQTSAGIAAPKANVSVESFGALGTCANIATISGAAVAPALAVGGVCWGAYKHMSRLDYEKTTAHRLDGTVIPRDEWIANYGDK